MAKGKEYHYCSNPCHQQHYKKIALWKITAETTKLLLENTPRIFSKSKYPKRKPIGNANAS